MKDSGLAGECRLCAASFLFANSAVMEAHYRGQHGQQVGDTGKKKTSQSKIEET